MNILDEVKQIIAAIPQTPREFLVDAFDSDWQHATIYRYPLADGGPYCYSAILWTMCPDCKESDLRVAVFTAREEGGYRLLKSDWGDAAHEQI